MKAFLSTFKGICVIVGTVVGAGFITGRELIAFFYGSDPFFVAFFSFILFFVTFFILLNIKELPKNKYLSVYKPIILGGNFIISAGMISVVSEIVRLIIGSSFCQVFAVLTLLFSNIILLRGIEGLKIVNLIIVPIILVVTITILSIKSSVEYVPMFSIKPFSIICYVGMNLFMNSPVFISLGQDYNKKTALLTSIFAAFLLSGLIFYILSSISSEGSQIIGSAVPLLALIQGNKMMSLIFSIVMYFGVITTLLSSYYTLFEPIKDKQKPIVWYVLLNVSVYIFSLIGFKNIIDYLYPLLGIIGIVYLTSIFVVSYLSSKRQINAPLSNKKTI